MSTQPSNTTAAERLSSNIRAELARLRKTQADLAQAVGRSENTVQRRLSCQVDWTLSELLAVAGYLGVPLSDLLDRQHPEEP